MNQTERHSPPIFRIVGGIGDQALYVLTDLGRMGIFLFFALVGLFKPPFRFKELIKQLGFIGAGSITVIFFTAFAFIDGESRIQYLEFLLVPQALVTCFRAASTRRALLVWRAAVCEQARHSPGSRNNMTYHISLGV